MVTTDYSNDYAYYESMVFINNILHNLVLVSILELAWKPISSCDNTEELGIRQQNIHVYELMVPRKCSNGIHD